MVSLRAPTSFLPPLSLLFTHTTTSMQDALRDLKDLYFPAQSNSLTTTSINAIPTLKQGVSDAVHVPLRRPPKRTGHLKDTDSIPDSGYASEEDEGKPKGDLERKVDEHDVLRSDELERKFAIRWLTSLIKRSDAWIHALDSGGQDPDSRVSVVEEACELLARFFPPCGDDDDDEQKDNSLSLSLTRRFAFPFGAEAITVELNDAPLTPTDHTCVGLQSWASAIIFAGRLCMDPVQHLISIPILKSERSAPLPLRVLELGAGTGLLSITTAQILNRMGVDAQIVATDYHPAVLQNLMQNVRTNDVSSSVQVEALDWSRPPAMIESESYDVILAADVVYHPEHAKWIKGCVEGALRKGGVFWLMIARRSTGRHEGLWGTVDDVFGDGRCGRNGDLEHRGGGEMELELAVVQKEEVGRREGIGRADELGYRLFEIRWL